MAVSANHLWFNLVDDNTTNPDSGGANWMPLGQAATQAEVDAGTRNDVFLTPSTLSKTAPDINFNCYATSNQNATPVAAFTVLTTHAKISGSSSAAVTGVNATRFTTPADCAGWYTLFANLAIPIQAGGSISINLRLNGSQFLSSATSLAGAQTNLAVSCSSYFYLSAGDYVEPMFYPTAAGGVIGSGYFTSFAGGLIDLALPQEAKESGLLGGERSVEHRLQGRLYVLYGRIFFSGDDALSIGRDELLRGCQTRFIERGGSACLIHHLFDTSNCRLGRDLSRHALLNGALFPFVQRNATRHDRSAAA